MKKIISAFFLITFLLLPIETYAQYVTPPVETESFSTILINKLVQNPHDGLFRDNLGSNEALFLPDQKVVFRIDITNTGNVDLINVNVKDQLPNFLDFISGPGVFDSGSKTINFTIDRLKPQETKTFEIVAKVNNTDNVLSDQVICVTNTAEARVNELLDLDTASVCVGAQILAAATELPKTGPEKSITILILSTLSLSLSTFLFKRFRNV